MESLSSLTKLIDGLLDAIEAKGGKLSKDIADVVIDFFEDKVTKLIPGGIDDAIILAIAGKIRERYGIPDNDDPPEID